jgi:UDP-glucose:(heptosyl)LPS alpha-1,3-glucosyltransferase
MKKITFVRMQDTPFGGAENYLKRLIKELKNRKIDVELLEFSQPKWLVSWIKLPLYNLEACKNKNDRFYFSNDRLSCLDIHRAGGGTHKSFLKTKGFTLNPLHLIYPMMEKKALKNSKAIIAISNMVKRDIIKDYKIDPKKIEVIYNGIEIPYLSKEAINLIKKDFCNEFKLKENRKIILYVGSGFKRKGVKEFLEILSNLKMPFYAFVVGKDKNLSKYKLIAKKLKIDDKVIFTGPREDVNKFYLSSDIFLFPTYYEPFGNVILEAMSFYNVVITTKQCGAGEILEDVPLMKNPKDYKIATFIDELISNLTKLESLKIKNRKISEKFSIQNNVDKTLELIKRVQNENFDN